MSRAVAVKDHLSPTEVKRRMPYGAKKWLLHHHTHNLDPRTMPGLILKYLMRNGVIKESRKPGDEGRLYITQTGQNVIRLIQRREEGQN